MSTDAKDDLEVKISEWRAYVHDRAPFRETDVDELESHLRDRVAELREAGLDEDEAFLIAVKRLGAVDLLSKEFAREHSDRLWKQLVLSGDDPPEPDSRARIEFLVMVGLAVAAALTVKAPALFGFEFTNDDGFYQRNLALLVLPYLAAYFAWTRKLKPICVVVLALIAVASAVLANVYPFAIGGATEVLTGIHLPILLWLVFGVAYMEGEWRSEHKRMDFVRFTGEWFIYYTLIGLGGGVLVGVTYGIFEAIQIDIEHVIQEWLIPCGVAGAVIVAAWLVERKQSVIENMAPVLTTVFAPLFAVMLLASLVAIVLTGNTVDVDRNVLILFDFLLVLVLGLLLYAISARDQLSPPTTMDTVRLILVLSSLVIDAVALAAIVARISEWGFSANKTAALGLNVILLVNLAWSAWLFYGFIRRRQAFAALEHWQTAYIPVYAIWAAIVVIAFPLIFEFV